MSTKTPSAVAAAAGTRKVAFAARQGSPRSAAEPRQGGKRRARAPTPVVAAKMNGGDNSGEKDGAVAVVGVEKASAAAGKGRQQNEPLPETSTTALSPEASEDHGSSSGNTQEASRQHRSSSNPWVEEAAIGKHYQPPSSTKLTGEAEKESSAIVERPVAASHGDPAVGGGTGVGDDNGDTKRRTSSVSWAEDIVAGNEGDGRQQGSPLEEAKSSVGVSVVEKTAASSSGASKSTDDGRNVAKDDHDPKRRTSSVSWAEDIVAGNGGESRQQSSPQEGVQSAVDASAEASVTKTTAKAPSGARSSGDSIKDIGEDLYRDPKRRTSSVSWAEDIAEGKGGVAQPQPSPRGNGGSAADIPTEVPSPSEGNDKGNAEESNDPKRRTSSISWAEDIVADQGKEAQQ